MNILILNWKDIKNPAAGGAEIVTHEHAKRWIKAGHSVTWLASRFEGGKEKESIDGIRIERKGNIYGVYFHAPFFYLFSGNKFDLVIDEVHGIPFFTPFFVRKPVLVLIHEIAGEIWDYMYGFPINYFGKLLERFYLFLYRNKSFWTDCNATIDELVEHGIRRKNCTSIYCPSNLKALSEVPQKNKEITLVWASRIVKMKGIEDVLEAFYLISQKFSDAKLLIIGDGEKRYVDYLKREIVAKHRLEKSVDFLGYVTESEKENVLRKSHLLLHASVKEGWGIVVIEAASQATPSIVYNVSGLSESVKDGVTGIVLTENSPKKMAQEAISLLENKEKYSRFQRNSLEWARSLNWEVAAKSSTALIIEVANEE
jgi:glycosyltransferase involved in cell wall biosynthesis